jgi:signal transduction histidine kinase
MKMTEQSLSGFSSLEHSAAHGAGDDDPRSAALETLDVLEAMADGLVYFDKHDRLVICNRRYRDFYPGVAEGATFAEQLKATVNAGQINLGARAAEEYLAWRLQLHKSPTTPIETALADGRWLRITARKTARGGTVAIHTEITQLKERETALRRVSEQLSEQNLLFDAALNNMIQGLCMFGPDQRLIVVNRRYLEMYGFSPQVVKPGITLREIMEYSVAIGNYAPEEGERALAERPTQAARREQDVSLQRLRDGRVIAVMHQPLANGGSVATYEDVTLREQTEFTLRQYATKLEQSNKELENFAFVASHDLQEPLRKIESFGNRLVTRYGDHLGDDGKMYIERMQNAASRMRRLIIDLLSYSRVTTKAQPFVPLKPEEILQEVLGDLQVAIDEAGATVDVGRLPMIEGDPTQIRQLFQNLISNAIKFRNKGTAPRIKVEGRIAMRGHGLQEVRVCQISVQDNGIGFDEKYLGRIFAVFQRLHGRNEYEGTGIGLATCRKIVDRHNGTIAAKSKPGAGATFIVTLPVEQIVQE